ncbi:bifunctional DNA primase/polymerase [Nocardia brasiliensis]|nr:bifunctional DNA primase/polymerase [Nocardia brasiliensis]
MTGPYATAALGLWDAGWHGVLPLPPGKKASPPEGYTGYSGAYPKYPDVYSWTEQHADGNIALRMPDDVIGIDVDAYGTKTGGATYSHAVRDWGVLPRTWMSTARTDGISGIRFYRVPPGTRLVTQITFPAANLAHIEIIQWFHRYAVVSPSIHPDTGKPYRWCDPDGFWADEPPSVDEFPALPARWVQELAAPAEAPLADVDVAAVLAALPAGPMNVVVTARLERAMTDLRSLGAGSRHDTTTQHVLALLRMAEQGRGGVAEALTALGQEFVRVVGADRGEGPARAEYVRMVTGPRGHQMIAATPTIDIATISGVAEEQRHIPGAATERRPVEPSPVAEPTTEPLDEFWGCRASLRTIRQFAFARMCSPWSVLGVVMARLITTVPPWITLPPLIGGRGSLNLFVALVGPSGGGKGASESAATDLFPAPVHVAPIGSGEGLAHQYAHIEKRVVTWDRCAVLFSESEIDTLAGIGSRTGSTLMGKLRNAFSGEEIGFSYADASRRITLGKHAYRMCFVLGVQPSKAGPLISDAGGGTPQRFVWLPTTDPGISVDRPPEPCSLPEGPVWGAYSRSVAIPKSAELAITENHVLRGRGDGHALDGHSLFVREKVALALAALDGRTDIGEDDWHLSGIVMEVSDRTREMVTAELRRAAREANAERGRELGEQRAVADAVAEAEKVSRVASWTVAKLTEFGGRAGWPRLHRRLASRDRDYLEGALLQLAEEGRIVITEEREICLYEASGSNGFDQPKAGI